MANSSPMTTPAPQGPHRGTSRKLLDAKLSPPARSSAWVGRSAIADAVCSARPTRLVLIRASAGFGKTTVMLECKRRLEDAGVATAWLTVDRADNDASRFLEVLRAALSHIMGDDGDSAPHASTDASDVGTEALDLMGQVASHQEPFALFLDEFEFIHEAGVHSLVRELISAIPRHSRLVIGTRTLPDLRLGRLRAQNELTEVDASQLRFTLEETIAFFARRTELELHPDDVASLHQKTEGWVAALWLASLALERTEDRRGFVRKFSGTDRAVAEYLAEEVLARQPPELRQFLQCTSVLRQLEPAICDYVLSTTGSAAILETLEQANAPLVRLGHGEPSYRYHSMFSGFLKQLLAREQPDMLRALHRRAAQWYMAQKRPVPAIDHAIEGGDSATAVSLLESHAGVLLAQGRMRILSRWFDALPAQAYDGHPLLVANRVWALCFTQGARAAADLLERSGIENDPSPELAAHLLALKPLLLTMMDRYEEAYEAGCRSLQHLPTSNAFADMILANAMTTVATVLGKHHEAHQLLDAARRRQGGASSAFNVSFSEAAEGVIDHEQGRLRQATARFRMAATGSGQGEFSSAHGNSWAGILYAAVCYESNDLDRAEHLLHAYLPIARDVQLTDHVIAGYLLLARIAYRKGDVDGAFQVLSELEYLGHERRLPRLVVGAHLARSRLHLYRGHPAAAREELDRADDPALWKRIGSLRLITNDTEYLALARLRWDTVAGDAADASRRLAVEIATARADNRQRRALKLTLLRAIALHRSGQPAEAHVLLHEVLLAASEERYLRFILDEGKPAGALLHSYLAARSSKQPAGSPILREYLQLLQKAFGPDMGTGDVLPAGVPASLSEPMTPKELRVLQLLAEGYSNNAIAEKLFVSDSTVRTHLRNVNSKLGTHNRTQAVAVARRLGLLASLD